MQPNDPFSYLVINKPLLSILPFSEKNSHATPSISTKGPKKVTEAYANMPYPTPARESSIDETVRCKFPGAHVIYGSGASGTGDNREIPRSGKAAILIPRRESEY